MFPYVLVAVAGVGTAVGLVLGVVRRPALGASAAYLARSGLLGALFASMAFYVCILLAVNISAI